MRNPLSQLRHVNISIKLTILLAVSALLPESHSAAQTAAYLLTFQNSSDYTIEQIYIAPSDRGYWGANELRDSILRSGALFRTRITGSGSYDFKFVNHNGNVCVLRNVGINRDLTFELTNEWLLDCESRRR